jgi:hypothetical protein
MTRGHGMEQNEQNVYFILVFLTHSTKINKYNLRENLGSHGGEYEGDSLLGYIAM